MTASFSGRMLDERLTTRCRFACPGEENPLALLIGLVGAIVGAAAGGFSAFLTGRIQMRRELEYAHYRELRTRRLDPYKSLYRRAKTLPCYWRTAPSRGRAHDLVGKPP